MSFYTVTLKETRMISRFDKRGVKISDETTTIDHVIHDLPWQTAKMYKDKAAAGCCEIVQQAPSESYADNRRHEVRFSDVKRKSAKPVSAKPKASAKDALANAARTGDMSAAINARA